MLYSPIEINKVFIQQFSKLGWNESRYRYFITTERELLTPENVKAFAAMGDSMLYQKVTGIEDFVRDLGKIAKETE